MKEFLKNSHLMENDTVKHKNRVYYALKEKGANGKFLSSDKDDYVTNINTTDFMGAYLIPSRQKAIQELREMNKDPDTDGKYRVVKITLEVTIE